MAAAAKKNDYITPLVGKKRTTYRVRVRIQGKYVSKTFDTISKAKEFAATATATVKAVADVADDDLILDIGPQTAAQLAKQINESGNQSCQQSGRALVQ